MGAVAAITAAALFGAALAVGSLWFAVYAVMLTGSIRDWLRWRRREDTREVADQLMAHLLIFAVGVAVPAFTAVGSWIGW